MDEQKINIVSELYSNPKHISAFSGRQKLYNAAKQRFGSDGITKENISDFLRGERSYTLHGLIPKNFIKRPIRVPFPGHTLGADLMDMGEGLKKYNKDFRYVLVLIDMFSRKVHAVALKRKTNRSVSKSIEFFLKQCTPHSYIFYFSDEGSEFYGKYTKDLFQKMNIKQYHVFNRRFKNSIAERFIRSIKSKVYRLFTHLNTRNYIDNLKDIVDTYNRSPHRGLGGLAPDVADSLTDENDIKTLYEEQLKQKFKNYGAINKGKKHYSTSVDGDIVQGAYVRLLLARVESVFQKSFHPIFTEEIFKVRDIDTKLYPPVYFLEDLAGEAILGKCYRPELKLTNKPEVFVIDKVLEKKMKKNREI